MLPSEAEFKILSFLWEHGACKAITLANSFLENFGWAKNTTYTMIHRAMKKGLISRTDPGFICTPLVELKDLQNTSIDEVRKAYFDNSNFELIKSLINDTKFSSEEINELYSLIDKEKRSK